MKTKEEPNAIRNKVEALNKRLSELTDNALQQVTGGHNELGQYRTIRRHAVRCLFRHVHLAKTSIYRQ